MARKVSRPGPLPLLDWTPPPALRRTDRRVAAIAGGIGVVLLGVSAVLDYAIHPVPRLVWNASASAPVGLWRIRPQARLGAGDMVLARTPASVRPLAARRGYVPANVPLVKRIAARDGDDVCAIGAMVFVNGRPVAARLERDRMGRQLPWWEGCEVLRGGRLLLLMDRADSFDGRYFGPIDEDAMLGKATPLWLR